MAVKRTGQLSFVDAFVASKPGAQGPLDRLNGLVKWYRLEKVAAHLRDDGPGRAGYPVLVLIKALLLQGLYGLSDRELEEALNDRLSFRRFAGLGLEDDVPDHTVLNRFRNRLVSEGLLDGLFAELDRQLDKAGLIVRRGTMLDATLIETSAASPPRGDAGQARDPDAGFAKRSGKPGSTYGYKAHVGVDEGSGIIRRVITTPANVNDTVAADALIMGDESRVWGDAAYHTHRRVAELKARRIQPRLMHRPNKHQPKLPRTLRLYNRVVARRRAAVETTFATLKNRMGLSAIRYVGLTKASAQVLIAAMAFNLRRWLALSPA